MYGSISPAWRSPCSTTWARGFFVRRGIRERLFYILLAVKLANILLDVVFVGVLRWGVTGTAVTTLLAQCLSAVLMLMALSRTRLPCRLALKWHPPCRQETGAFLKLGLPAGIQSALYPIANILVQSSINQFGTESIAAWAVCGKLDFLIWLICDAMSATNATLVAQNIGAGQAARARQGVRIGTLSALLCVAGIGGVLTVGSVPLGSCFVDDEGVLSLVGQIMAWLAPLYVLYVPGGVLPGAIRGAGDTLRPMMATLMASCGVRVIWVLFVAPTAPSLFFTLTCYPVSWAVTSLVFVGLYAWKRATGSLGR